MRVSRRDPWASGGKAKTVAVASPPVLRRIRTSMRRLGIAIGPRARHLGIIFGPRARTKEGWARESRWVRNAARCARVARLGRRLGSHVFNTGLKPVALYGASVAAPRLGTVKVMRRAVGRTLGKMKGRSLTARLAVNGCDLAWDALKAPTMAWIRAVWDERIPRHSMQQAWIQGQRMTACALRPFAVAGGAAGSFLASLKWVRWSSTAYNRPDPAASRR